MDLSKIRDEFPVTRRWIFFDHAAVAPLTGRAWQLLSEWAADMAENGDVHEHRWTQRMEEVRGLVARMLNTESLNIAFVKNTSEGIGIVAEGFPWRPGDNVVTAAEEYPSNIYPWLNLASHEVETRMVASREGRVWLDDLKAAVDSRTRIISLSHVEFATGFRNDLDAIGAFCRERDIFFFVDAIQGLGVLPLDVKKTPIDFLAADGHKWMLGPEGAGIFYIRPELVEMLHPIGVGWNSVIGARNFSKIDFRLKPHAGRWESGTLNVAGIHALGGSLEVLLGIGLGKVAARVLELTDYLCERAQKIGIEVFSSRRAEDRSGIVSLVVPGADVPGLVRRCRNEGVVVNHRGGRIRVSPHCYNTFAEVDRMLSLLRVTRLVL